MKIWEAIIYGIVGGITELLPVSFSGHYAVLNSAFHVTPLWEGGGYYVHAALVLGVMGAIVLSFRPELTISGREALFLLGLKKRRRHERTYPMVRRSLMLGFFALLPTLLSLLYCTHTEKWIRLPLTALFFAINGTAIFFAARVLPGRKTERSFMLPEALAIGTVRAASCFCGLSPLSSSLCVGRACGLSQSYNLRFAYTLSLVFGSVNFVFRLIRAMAYGTFSGAILLLMLFAALFAAIFGYLAIQYFKYLMNRDKLGVFAYYCWDAAVIVLILALINA